MATKPTMLIIVDGFGYYKEKQGNAVLAANMPTYEMLLSSYPHKLLKASGRAVGLPDGFMGNSEVGHLTIGAGRVIKSPLCRFQDSIDDGSFFQNELLNKKFLLLAKSNKSLHIVGLLSDAGVHSYEKHLYAIIQLAKKVGLKKIYVHAILDGRDCLPKSAEKYLAKCENLASLHGRFYAMDRDKNLDRTKKSYDVMVGQTELKKRSWRDELKKSYDKGITDEFFEPINIDPEGVIRDGDGIFFFNFRPDRAVQLSEMFIKNLKYSFFITTTRYKKEFNNDVLFENEKIENTLLEKIANKGKVFVIAETEKYAHVTYFFSGMVDKKLPNETRMLIASIKAKNYINHPEMSADLITAELVKSLKEDPAYFYLVNYANCDMVGHSGDFDATVKACECVDKQLKILYELVVEKLGGTIFLTSDHGNAEEKLDKLGNARTSHTLNPVPFVTIDKKLKGTFSMEFEPAVVGLETIAPTILQFLGI